MASCSSLNQGENPLSKFTPTTPHFFKIILDDTIANGRLGIPRKFLRKYGSGLSSPVQLRVPCGSTWNIELTKSEGDVWLNNGWKRFMDNYMLKRGHFLLFRYEGNCHFEVHIFDMSASEIEYPCINHAEDPKSNEECEELNTNEAESEAETVASLEVLHETSPLRKTKDEPRSPCSLPRKIQKKTSSTDKNDRDSENVSTGRRTFGANEYDKALQKAYGFRSQNPFFVVTMQPSYINPGRKMCIPTDFTMKFLKENQGDITLCTSDEKTWSANYWRYKTHDKYTKAVLYNGWRPFMQENKLEAGDVCVFELIKRTEILLKVVIYRVNEDSNRGSSSGEIKSNHPYSSRPLTSHEKTRAILRASSFKSKNPFFKVVMQPAYLKDRSSVNIPFKFAKKYIDENKDQVTLQVSDGRTWTVKFAVNVVSSGQHKAKFHHYWKSFAWDNNLQVGDVCVFELINRSKTSFKVSIFPAAPDDNVPLLPQGSAMASHHGRCNGYSPESHGFFRVVLQDTIRDGKIDIPLKFARDYGNALSSPIFLKVPNGEVWEVELTKCGGKMWLQNGWQSFAEHYSLEFGHFLVFRHEGNGHFHVLIFDCSATEIEYPYANGKEKVQQKEVKIEESEDGEPEQFINGISTGVTEKPELKCSRPHKMMKANPSDKAERSLNFQSIAEGFENGFSGGKGEMRSTTVCRVQQQKSDKKSKALQRASSAFKSTNPFFLVFMQPTYVDLYSKTGCFLFIPREFSREYLNDHGDAILCDSNGKTWASKYCSILGSNKRPYARLCNGWGTFVRDNNLQVGDVCALELIDCIEITFKVFIYRGKKADFHGSQASTDVFCPPERELGTSSTHQGCREPMKACETAPQISLKARKRAHQRALAFTSENPFFVVVLQPSYIRMDALHISNQFASRHFNGTLTNVDVILCLSNGKSWPVEYHQRSTGNQNGRICNGWRFFVRDNNLKVGDVCVFEMTDYSKICFKVTIFRAIDDENCHPSPGVSKKPSGSTSESPKAASGENALVPPSFRRVVLSLHLKEQHVGIPFRFAEQYLKPNTEMVILKVADRSWPVKITSDPCYCLAKLTSGWIEFARENSLREGDICLYELDTANNGLLKVSISRSSH
ncbi:hypothetical protein DITRI_Ditri16bG0028500 [Diplodiscus trichospermus]